MTIGPGTRLGPYEVSAPIGEGGMGRVWRAHHTALKRDDALKVLPEAFASDPDRLARFRREAQVLASLNHPNIAHVYGLEQSDGVQALVMELVEGPTLAERLEQVTSQKSQVTSHKGYVGRVPRSEGERARRGPAGLPIDEALAIARQMAEGLEAAHEQGIIHRDLKPANIKVRPDGTVKILDFGLAKALEPRSVTEVDATASPTITSPALMTGAGVLLGTAAYMSPEQARGKAADKRSDMWAFGCVVYEMLSGKRAFDGDDVVDTLGAVARLDPDWNALPADVPAAVRTLLRTCLTKDRGKRRIDATAALFVFDNATGLAPSSPSPSASAPPARWQRMALGATASVIGAALTGGAVWWAMRPAPPAVVRTQLITAANVALSTLPNDRNLAITSDGSRLIYRGSDQLVVRALDRLEPIALSGLGAAPRGPFVSPDGEWVGFFDSGFLKKVSTTGGPAVTITPIDSPGPRGATWGPDGTIVFATTAPSGLQRVSAAGSDPVALTKPDRQGDHFWPEFLPGGQAVLFTIVPTGGLENAQVAVLDLRTGASKALIRDGSHAYYLPTGHLVYAAAGTLRAVRFDLRRLEVIGAPVPVVEDVATMATGGADFVVSENGSLAYVAGSTAGGQLTVVSVDREGRASRLPGIPLDMYRDVRVSPDGTRLALAAQNDLWTYDIARDTLSRLTTHPAQEYGPLWTPDGQRIAFTSWREGYPEIFWRSADGTGSDERLLTRGTDIIDVYAYGWSPDGMQLIFSEVRPSRNLQCANLQARTIQGEPTVLVKNEFCNGGAVVSPDGRWIAYHSNLSGRSEIYVERYPQLGSRKQISTSGGELPLWSRDGGALYFRSLDNRRMLSVGVQAGATFTAGQSEILFELEMQDPQGGSRPYDVAPNGSFFIIRSALTEGSTEARTIVLVQNWVEELKRLVPVN
jgi:serine/threonine protein kinase